jgi:hypothetical protein
LQQVVIAGHGAGADFTQRYAAIGMAPDLLAAEKIAVRFMVANASSYLYLTSSRPSVSGPGFTASDTAPACPDINDYPYGLDKLVAYARRSGGNAVRMRFPERKVIYLTGAKIAADPFPDTDCAALEQGKDRLSRARNYERYLGVSFGDAARASQTFVTVPSAGYDPVGMFGSYCGLSILFGDGECGATAERQ